MAGATEALKEQVGIAKRPITILDKLESMKPQIAAALPRHLTPERMVRIAITCLRTNPKLAECDAQTILASVMLASQLGLEPGVLGQCFLVPYKTTCTLVPGWLGILDLVNRAGKATAWTGAVYAGDEFDWSLGDSPYVRHRPCGDETTLTHAYAIARVKGSNYPIIEVWPVEKVWKHRNRFNKVGEKHYSYTHPEMYARKVALLQALKYVPRSVELATAFQLDATAEMGEQNLQIKDVPSIIEGATFQSEPQVEQVAEEPKQQQPRTMCGDCEQFDGAHLAGCKYAPAPAEEKVVPAHAKVADDVPRPTQKDWARLHASLAKKGITHEDLKSFYTKAYKVESGSELTLAQFQKIEKEVSGWKAQGEEF